MSDDFVTYDQYRRHTHDGIETEPISASNFSGILGVSNGGTGVATLTAHGVLIGEGTGNVVATAVGATNTVLHGNTGADPSYSAVVEADITLADNTTDDVSTSKHGFVPKAPNDTTKFLRGDATFASVLPTIKCYTDFETAGRFTLANGGGGNAPAFNAGGAALHVGNAGYSTLMWGALPGTGATVFAIGCWFTAMFSMSTVGTDDEVYIGLGNITNAATGHTFTQNHIGFKVIQAGGTGGNNLTATVANGTTETASTTITNLSANDSVFATIHIVSASQVDFTVSINNLGATTKTITTNIPSASTLNQTVQASLNNRNVNNVNDLNMVSMGVEY